MTRTDEFEGGAAGAVEGADPMDEERLIEIIEQAIFETDTGLEAAMLAAERINAGRATTPEAPASPPPLSVEAMAETLRFLYHASEPCDAPNKHRHDHIAAGIVGQYPRISSLQRFASAAPSEPGER